MAEFGHHFTTGAGFAIDGWGAGPFQIEVDGRTYSFEDSDRFGPFILGKRGDVLTNQPGGRSPFWRAYHMWRRDGRRMAEDRKTCVWREPKPGTYRRDAKGRRWALSEPEWDGAGYIEETDR